MRIPPGSGLLLSGSGLYWILAGPLIGWFSVFNPAQIRLSQLGLTMILATGIICLVVGLWTIHLDFEELNSLFSRNDGWIFTIPIILVVADVYLTLIGLSRGDWELNPFVSSAVQMGSSATVPFVISYMALSEGLALAILSIGKWLFGPNRTLEYLPFALVCGAASIGPLNNIELVAASGGVGSVNHLVLVIIGMLALTAVILWHFRRTIA